MFGHAVIPKSAGVRFVGLSSVFSVKCDVEHAHVDTLTNDLQARNRVSVSLTETLI